MFGSQARPPRPILLLLVYGAFLAIVGVTATAQSMLVGAHFSTATLTDLVNSDAATIRAFVGTELRPSDLTAEGRLTTADVERLESRLVALTGAGQILRLEVRRPDGTIVVASEPGLHGIAGPTTGGFTVAAGGKPTAAIGSEAEAGAGPERLGSPTVLREFLPLTVDGTVRGIVGVWRDGAPIVARLDAMQREIVLVTLSAALVAAALLFVIFRSTQARLSRQTLALLESTRRDPLTGLLNHGALVDLLAIEMEGARVSGRPLGIALLDIDNFRLLNDNHGHPAGDEALLAVARLLDDFVIPGIDLGRYG
ncbi:MAG: diguanylate cyclase, partial [Candidatus Limnocylindrales bacterium]